MVGSDFASLEKKSCHNKNIERCRFHVLENYTINRYTIINIYQLIKKNSLMTLYYKNNRARLLIFSYTSMKFIENQQNDI